MIKIINTPRSANTDIIYRKEKGKEPNPDTDSMFVYSGTKLVVPYYGENSDQAIQYVLEGENKPSSVQTYFLRIDKAIMDLIPGRLRDVNKILYLMGESRPNADLLDLLLYMGIRKHRERYRSLSRRKGLVYGDALSTDRAYKLDSNGLTISFDKKLGMAKLEKESTLPKLEVSEVITKNFRISKVKNSLEPLFLVRKEGQVIYQPLFTAKHKSTSNERGPDFTLFGALNHTAKIRTRKSLEIGFPIVMLPSLENRLGLAEGDQKSIFNFMASFIKPPEMLELSKTYQGLSKEFLIPNETTTKQLYIGINKEGNIVPAHQQVLRGTYIFTADFSQYIKNREDSK